MTRTHVTYTSSYQAMILSRPLIRHPHFAVSCTHIRRSTFLGFWNALPGVAFFQLVAEPSVGFGQLDVILAGDDDVWSSGKTGHGGKKSLCSETCSRQCKEQDGRAMLWC